MLIGDVTHHEEAIRSAGAEALSSAVSQYKDQSATVLGQLTELYHQKLYVRACAKSELLLQQWLLLVDEFELRT